MNKNTSLFKTWTELKSFLITPKNLKLQYDQKSHLYYIFVVEDTQVYFTELWTDTSKVRGINVTQNNIDLIDFETNYKSNSNQPIHPKDLDGKTITRAESRPLDHTTYFTCKGDSVNDIGDGTELIWDFSNDNDELLLPSGSEVKTKRLEFQFLDSVYVKEGAIYFINTPFGSYIDLKVVCPSGQYYLDNNKSPVLATEDTVVSHYVNNHYMCGDCPMGDELNTESCSDEIPNNYKFCLDITVPITNDNCTGHISLELYRKRTVIL